MKDGMDEDLILNFVKECVGKTTNQQSAERVNQNGTGFWVEFDPTDGSFHPE